MQPSPLPKWMLGRISTRPQTTEKNALALRYLHTPAAGKDAPGSRRGVSAESPNPRLV